jgi:hypothetical protein
MVSGPADVPPGKRNRTPRGVRSADQDRRCHVSRPDCPRVMGRLRWLLRRRRAARLRAEVDAFKRQEEADCCSACGQRRTLHAEYDVGTDGECPWFEGAVERYRRARDEGLGPDEAHEEINGLVTLRKSWAAIAAAEQQRVLAPSRQAPAVEIQRPQRHRRSGGTKPMRSRGSRRGSDSQGSRDGPDGECDEPPGGRRRLHLTRGPLA